MKRRELENLLLTLETTPLVLAAHFRARGKHRVSPVSVEDRITLLAEIEETTWAEQAAAMSQSPAAPAPAAGSRNAFDRFTRARAANLVRLKDAAGLGGAQPPAATENLRALLEAMAAADRTQLAEISRGLAQKESCRESSGRHAIPVLV